MEEPVHWLFNRQIFFASGPEVTGLLIHGGRLQLEVARPRFHDGWSSVDPDPSESGIVEKVSGPSGLISQFIAAVKIHCRFHVGRISFQMNELGE